MKNLCAFSAVFLATLASPLSAAIVRVQTIVSRYVETDKTELVGARVLTTGSSIPSTFTLGNVAISMLALEGEKSSVQLSTRLAEKLADGTLRRHEGDSVTITIGQTTSLRLGDYKLEITPTIAELPGFAVDFPGGTIAQFLDQLPKNHDSMVFNLVGEKADLQTELPPIRLKVGSPGTLALALNSILNPKGLAIGLSQSGVTDFSGRTTVYVLQKASEPDSGQSPDSPRFRSYDLTDYLDEKMTIDQITQAIRSAWELRPDNKPDALRIKYHSGTSLLLVNGPEAAIKTVDTVIGSMRSKTRGTSAAFEAQRLESVAEEVRRRRELRQAAAIPTDPALTVLPEFGTYPTTPAMPSTPRASTPAESPEQAAERLRIVREEVERRRASRPSSEKTPSSTPPAQSPAPATTK